MRTLVLKKVIQSLSIFLSCVLLIYIISACDGNLADGTQETNLVQTLNEVTERNSHEEIGGRSEIGALSSVTNGQSVQISSVAERQGKRKKREETSPKHVGNGSVDNSQGLKRSKVEGSSIGSEQPVPTSSPLPTGEKTNKRKKREDAAKGSENSIVKDGKHLERVTPGSPKKAKVEREDIQQDNNVERPNIDGPYNTMEVQELAKLANNNDIQAQKEIINRCLQGTMIPLLASLINPFSWVGIKEKALRDEQYVYLLLRCGKRANDADLYVQLLESIKVHAASGNLLAQINLGYIYERCIGIKKGDIKEAVKWYTAATNQGSVIAKKLLGDMRARNLVTDYSYKKSDCKTMTEYNEKQAAELYTQAAEQGYTPALTSLGYLYQTAKNISRLYRKAIECYERAAAQGDTQAKFYLGKTYYHGKMTSMHYRGVSTNYEKAFKWFSEAANEGHADAQEMLGLMYNNGESVEQDFDIAAEWYKRAAEKGSRAAQVHMGIIYQEGRGVPKDLAKAIYWFVRTEDKSELRDIFKESKPLLSLTGRTSPQEVEKIASNLLSNWQTIPVQEEQNQANEPSEAYRQLKEIVGRFEEWRLALGTQSELMVSCLQFREQKDKVAIENRQKETGETPYVKQHTLGGKDYLSFGQENVEMAEAIVTELIERTFYNQVMGLLKQIAEKNETAKNMQEERAKQFDRYYTLFLEAIEQGQCERNQRFQEKHPYFFRTY